jgi:invasion protein IalB
VLGERCRKDYRRRRNVLSTIRYLSIPAVLKIGSRKISQRRSWAVPLAAAVAVGVYFGGTHDLKAQDGTLAAWRVECSGDGKALECRAFQQMVQDKQLVAQITVRVPPDSKSPVMMIQLPLGLNVAEPVELKVDNGQPDRQRIQTCTSTGCFAGSTLNDKFVSSMRSGTYLKVAFQDSAKKAIAFDIPLLGFGLALDKIK